jgi:hypothetical protein
MPHASVRRLLAEPKITPDRLTHDERANQPSVPFVCVKDGGNSYVRC